MCAAPCCFVVPQSIQANHLISQPPGWRLTLKRKVLSHHQAIDGVVVLKFALVINPCTTTQMSALSQNPYLSMPKNDKTVVFVSPSKSNSLS